MWSSGAAYQSSSWPDELRRTSACSNGTVILRCEPLRASKDVVPRSACGHPSRRRFAPPQDDVSASGSARRATHLRAPKPVQPLREKYFALFLTQLSCVLCASHPTRGALRTSRNARVGCDGRKSIARRAIVERTAKSCGPDAPMAGVKFARSSRFLRMTVTNKLWSRRGEHGISRKPLRREGRSVSAEPVCSCAFFLSTFAHETAGAARTRSSLRPLCFGGERICKTRAHAVARMRRCVSGVVVEC